MNLVAAIRRMPVTQQRAGKLLLSFFALMLALTLVSRSLNAATLPTVTTTSVSSGNISRKITLEGTVEPLAQTAVTAPAGHTVASLLVEEGNRVEEGDILALLDMQSLEEKLTETSRELEKLRLNARLDVLEADIPRADPVEEAQLALDRAEEDLKRVQEESSQSIGRAQFELGDARRELRELRSDGYEDGELDAAKKAVIQRMQDAEEAVIAAEKAETQALRAIEDAKRGIQEAQREREKQEAEDALAGEKNALQTRISALDMASREEEIEKLRALIATEGKILAPTAGVVGEIQVSAGAATTGGGVLLLSDQSRGFLFKAEVEEESGKHLERGDTGTLVGSGGGQGSEYAVTSVSPPKEKGGSYTVTVQIADTQLEPGSSAVFTVEKSGAPQEQVVPLTALYAKGAGSNQGYVFVLREKTTTLGTETVVEQVDVEVLDKNSKFASIQGIFSQEDRVVSTSSRSLTQGDRVRVEEAL